MCSREFGLIDIERGETVIVLLPLGRMMEIEWLDSAVNSVRVRGFESRQRYLADEEYRLAGFEPLLKCFHQHIPMHDF